MKADVDPDFWRERGVSSSPGTPGFKGALAGAVAAVARRRVTGLSAGCRPSPRCTSSPACGEGMARRSRATCATPRRSPRRVAATRARRSSSTWPRSRSCAVLRRAARDLRDERDGHRERARRGARHAGGVRAVVNVTTDKCYENREWEWGYREDEPMGGHDPYSSSQGLRRARHERLPPLVLRRSRRAARGLGARRQRDRRRRLGRGPAHPRHHARRARGRAGARAQSRTRSGPGSTCSTRSAATSCSRRRCGESPEHADGWNFGPAERGRAPGRLDRRAAGRAVARASCAGRSTTAPHPHEARYLKLDSSRARARLGWRPRWDLDEALAEHRRLVPGAARRRRHARRSRSAQIEAFAYAAALGMSDDRLPLLRRAAARRLRRPRHVAARERLPAAGAAQRDGAVLSAARARLRRVLPRAARGVRVARGRSSPTTPTSRRTRRAGSSTPRATPSTMIERFGLGGDSQVVEIASNDGYLLQYFVERGVPVLGIEPAANVAEVARASGHPDAGRVLRRATAARELRRASARPTCCSATTCSPTCPTSTTSSAGMKVAAQARRRDHDGVPAPAAADRRATSSTRSTTSTSRTSRSSPSRAVFAAHGLRALRRRGAADARRLAAHLRLPRRRRRASR